MQPGIAARPQRNASSPAGSGLTGSGSSLLLFLITSHALGPVHAQEAAGETGRIEEIVVTAQHREERMQDIPTPW